MLTEDFSAYFDPNGIGDTATVGGVSVNGIFDTVYAEVNQVEGYYPTFLCVDTVTATTGTTLVFDAVTYSVISRRLAEVGLIVLVLEET